MALLKEAACYPHLGHRVADLEILLEIRMRALKASSHSIELHRVLIYVISMVGNSACTMNNRKKLEVVASVASQAQSESFAAAASEHYCWTRYFPQAHLGADVVAALSVIAGNVLHCGGTCCSMGLCKTRPRLAGMDAHHFVDRAVSNFWFHKSSVRE